MVDKRSEMVEKKCTVCTGLFFKISRMKRHICGQRAHISGQLFSPASWIPHFPPCMLASCLLRFKEVTTHVTAHS